MFLYIHCIIPLTKNQEVFWTFLTFFDEVFHRVANIYIKIANTPNRGEGLPLRPRESLEKGGLIF